MPPTSFIESCFFKEGGHGGGKEGGGRWGKNQVFGCLFFDLVKACGINEVLQSVVEYCSVLQCVAVSRSVLGGSFVNDVLKHDTSPLLLDFKTLLRGNYALDA